jgi:hypothetical protein
LRHEKDLFQPTGNPEPTGSADRFGRHQPAAVFLAPVTWPLFIVGFISLYILKAILYGIFLVTLAIALVVIRKPFIFIWLDKLATRVGNILLKANTMLIKLFLNPWLQNPQPT